MTMEASAPPKATGPDRAGTPPAPTPRIAAIANDEVIVVGGNGALIFDITTWGWIQLILGITVGLTGLGLLTGNQLARVLGIFLLSANAVLQVVWFTAAPLWAVMMIALDIVIIYQLISGWVEEGSN
jgi:hypothetical protein